MLSHVFLAIGLVLVIEGLVFALAPLRMEDLLRAMSEISPETRRMLGLGVIALGVVIVWWASKGLPT